MDIVISIPCTVLLGNLLSKRKISKNLPHNSLFTYDTLLSFFVHLIYVFGLIIFSCIAVKWLPDYKSPQQIEDDYNENLENNNQYTDLPYFETTVRDIKFLFLGRFYGCFFNLYSLGIRVYDDV